MRILRNTRDLLADMLGTMYDAERQQEKLLRAMGEMAADQAITDAFRQHIDDTVSQEGRLACIAELLEIDVPPRACMAMNGLALETAKVMNSTARGSVLDAALVPAAQRIDHYEIASYEALCELARSLGEEEIAAILEISLKEERKSSEMFAVLGRESINSNPVLPAA